jgi:hypothetical protein
VLPFAIKALPEISNTQPAPTSTVPTNKQMIGYGSTGILFPFMCDSLTSDKQEISKNAGKQKVHRNFRKHACYMGKQIENSAERKLLHLHSEEIWLPCPHVHQ